MNRRQFVKKGALLIPAFGIFVPKLIRAGPPFPTGTRSPYRNQIFPPATGGGGPTTPPSFDAASSATPGNGTTSLTWAHTCTGSSGLICIFIGQGQTNPPKTITSVTYNGDACTELGTFAATDSNFVHVTMWYRVAPDTGGSFNIVATAASAIDQFSGGAISLSGAAQSSTFGTPVPASGSGTTASTTVSSSTAALVVCSTMTDSVTITVGTGTSRFEVENIEADTSHGGSTVAGATSVTPTWTLTDTTGWAISAVSVNGL